MALLFNTKELKVDKPEPLTKFQRCFGPFLVELIIISLIVAAFWRIFRALGIF
jgi:hypothetical protein